MFTKKEDFVSPIGSQALRLIEDDYVNAARRLNLPEVAIIKAVVEVESAGKGFDDFNRPKILFEAHVFNRLTGGKYLNKPFSKQPSKKIAVAEWDKSNYPSPSLMYDILIEAIALDQDAALKSASWNLMQILGNNYKICGAFDSVQTFVASQIVNEARSLEAFCHFVLANRIDDELRAKNWAGFAYIYNGKSYKKNQYDTKLANAYARHAAADNRRVTVTPVGNARKRAAFTGMKHPNIKKLQQWLNQNVKLPIALVEDGTFGRKTDEALDLAVLQKSALGMKAILTALGLGNIPV